tara:strand:+ start:110 stop:472 length:363 start_codon:yes stop_codon:yes gene_type:complete
MNHALVDALDSWFSAYDNGDVEGVISLHTADASLFGNGAPGVNGQQAIRATVQGMLDSGLKHISHEVAEADAREDMGYLLASMSLETPETGKISAKVVDVLMRQPDGTWKFHATCWNLDS